MKAPKLLAVAETMRAGEHLATVTLQVPLEDLAQLVDNCDASDAAGAGLDQAVARSRKARELADAERHAAQPAPPAAEPEPAPPAEPTAAEPQN